MNAARVESTAEIVSRLEAIEDPGERRVAATAEMVKKIEAIEDAGESEAGQRAFVALLSQRRHDDERYRAEPEAFCREVLGSVPWSRAQRRVGQIVADAALADGSCQVLALGGHGTGKSYVEDCMTIWVWGPVSRQLGPDGEPQGCDVILTAPTSGNIERTSYHQLLALGRIAAAKSYVLAGWAPRSSDSYRGPSDARVRWFEGPWRMVGINPQQTALKDVAHAAGGMHHPHRMVIRMEEALGVPPGMLHASKGLAAAGNVLTMAATNPTNTSGPLYGVVRANPDAWKLVPFSQLEHQNVRLRRRVVPGSVSHLILETALRSSSFQRMGPADSTPLDDSRMDVVYALPDPDLPDAPGPRYDGIPGHPDATPWVFRPDAMAAGQNLGGWLDGDDGALLFNIDSIAKMMAQCPAFPDGHPDQVGIDCAPTRPPAACARRGIPARVAFDAYEEFRIKWSEMRPVVKSWLSRPVALAWPAGADPNQQGEAAAADAVGRYGRACRYVLDRAFGGQVGQALKNLGCGHVDYVTFGDPPEGKPSSLYGVAQNRRVEIYMDAATALNAGLVSPEYSEDVLEQMRAAGPLLESPTRGRRTLGKKADMGPHMDELDAACLALCVSSPIGPAESGMFGPWG